MQWVKSAKISASYYSPRLEVLSIRLRLVEQQSVKISVKLRKNKKVKKISKKVLTFGKISAIIVFVVEEQRKLNMRLWRNWQTR